MTNTLSIIKKTLYGAAILLLIGASLMSFSSGNTTLTQSANTISGDSVSEKVDQLLNGTFNASSLLATNAYAPNETFKNEIISTDVYQSVLSNQDSTVVGFVATDTPENVLNALSKTLLQKGWVEASGENQASATFIKNTGTYKWTYISCISVGNKTSVVMQSTKE